MIAPIGSLEQAYLRANHFELLDLALLWDEAARVLAPSDAEGARRALRHAIGDYRAYRDEWSAHLPASRWDHDYGPELSAAEERLRRLSDRPGELVRAAWVEDMLERRFSEALAHLLGLPAPPTGEGDRALVAVLSRLCAMAGMKDAAEKLGGRAP